MHTTPNRRIFQIAAPEREQIVTMPKWDDSCGTCGVCDESGTCAQCGRTLCDECRSPAGRCCLCESYNLPANFAVLPETAWGISSTVDCWLNSHCLADIPKPHVFWYDDPKLRRVATVKCRVWAGVGVHYHTDIEEDADPMWWPKECKWVTVRDHNDARPQWSEMTCRPKTAKAAAAWVRRELIKHYGKKPTFVIFQSSTVRRWFYRNGD